MKFRRWHRLPLIWGFALVLTLMSSQLIAPIQARVEAPVAQELRGVWLTTNDLDVIVDRPRLHNALDQLTQLNFNTLYPVVWNSGYVLFPSDTAKRAGIQTFIRRGLQDYDLLEELASEAHRRGLAVIPWFEFGFMAPPTSEMALNHPDWLTQKRDGGQTWLGAAGEVVWLNPFRPEVQQFLTQLVLELVSRYDIDGIQFDDHFSLPVEFGYDSYTRNLYRRETGRAVPADPHNPSWVKWRADKLSDFTRRLSAAVKARQRDITVSIAPNPYDYAYKAQVQDWRTWVRQGWVDELIVQIYRASLGAFRQQLYDPTIQEARRKIPTAAGILTGLRNSPVPISFIEAKVRSARSAGVGMAFFFYESLWEQAPEPAIERQERFRDFFSTPTAGRRSGTPAAIAEPL